MPRKIIPFNEKKYRKAIKTVVKQVRAMVDEDNGNEDDFNNYLASALYEIEERGAKEEFESC